MSIVGTRFMRHGMLYIVVADTTYAGHVLAAHDPTTYTQYVAWGVVLIPQPQGDEIRAATDHSRRYPPLEARPDTPPVALTHDEPVDDTIPPI